MIRACGDCGGPMASGTITYCDAPHDQPLLVRGVPALICQQCGAHLLDDTVVQSLIRLSTERPAPARVEPVGVYEYAQVAQPLPLPAAETLSG